MTPPPRFVWAVVVAAVVGAIILGLVAWQVVAIRNAEEVRDCARAIASRDDSRTMWLYVLDTATSSPEKIEMFREKLNELLPALKCDGGNWVPKN